MLNNKILLCLSCLSIAIFTSACEIRETTSTQRQYKIARDECREISQLQLSPTIRQQGGANQKKELLIEFQKCMERTGWSVTAPKRDSEKEKEKGNEAGAGAFGQAPVPVQVQPLQAPPPSTAPNPEARRAAECAYARQAINHSSNARAIATGCDIECANQKRLAPDALAPAACAP